MNKILHAEKKSVFFIFIIKKTSDFVNKNQKFWQILFVFDKN